MKITETLIEQGKSGSGGWTREQLQLLGVPWPPIRGWKRRIYGNMISDEDASFFVALKGKTIKRKKWLKRKVGNLSELILNFGEDLD